MPPNPILKKLGLSAGDRAVIFHADDIGMCHASLAAYADLMDFGLLSSASTMVPCPWFPATATYCRENQGTKPLDMGVHLTLTSEWQGYRWGPISTRDPNSGLMDNTGYFHADTGDVQAQAGAPAVQREIEMQVERAVAAGIDITHIDSHMGSAFHPKFLFAYVQIALKHHVPALMIRQDETRMKEIAAQAEVPLEFADVYVQQVQTLEAQGFPMLDDHYGMSLDAPENRLELAKKALDGLSPGITYFIIHPAKDCPELRAITPDWQARVADYHLFTDGRWQRYVEQSGVRVIGYRELRELMRNGS